MSDIKSDDKKLDIGSLFGKNKNKNAGNNTTTTPTEAPVKEAPVAMASVTEAIESADVSEIVDAGIAADSAPADSEHVAEVTRDPETGALQVSPGAIADTGVADLVPAQDVHASITMFVDVSPTDLFGTNGTKILKSMESQSYCYRVVGDKRIASSSMRAVVVSPKTFAVIAVRLLHLGIQLSISEKPVAWFTDVAFSSLTNGKIFGQDGTVVHAIVRKAARMAGSASVLVQRPSAPLAYLIPANLYAYAITDA